MPALAGTPLNTYVGSALQHSSTPLLHPFWDLGFGFSPFHRLVMAFYGILPFMYCAACGAELPLGARFCPRCGRAIHSPQSTVEGQASAADIDAAAQQK